MLQKSTLNISLAGGLDQKTDPFLVENGLALELENARFQKTGKLSKRYGLALISNTTNVGNLSDNTVNFIAGDDEYMAAVTNKGIFGYSVGDLAWYKQSSFGLSSKIESDFVVKNAFDQKACDMDWTADGTHVAYVCRQERPIFSFNILIVLEDVSTGLLKTKNVLVASSTIGLQRIIVVKNAGEVLVHVFYYDGTNVLRDIYDENMVAVGALGQVITTGANGAQFDLCKSATDIYFARILTTNMQLRKYSFDGTQTATASVTNAQAIRLNTGVALGMSMVFSGSTLHIAWVAATAEIGIRGFNSSLVQTVPEFEFSTGALAKVSIHATSTGLSYAHDDETPSTESFKYGTIAVGAVYSFSQERQANRVVLASQTFVVDGKDLAIMRCHEALQLNASFFVMNLTDGYMAQTFSTGQAVRNFVTGTVPVSMLSKSIVQNSVMRTALSRGVGGAVLDDAENLNHPGLTKTIHDFTSVPGDGTRCKIGDRIYITKGATIELDKSNPHDNGFVLSPRITLLSAVAGVANANVSSKTFSYISTYEYRDSSGNLTQSAPSIPINITTPANTEFITIEATTTVYSLKSRVLPDDFSNIVSVSFYRTTSGGSTYYKIFNKLTSFNDGRSTGFNDVASDASISNNAILYTAGNVLQNEPPPAARFSFSGGNRLFLGGLEEKDEIAYSKKQLFGESVAFNDFFRLRVSSGTSADKSPISAGGYMDGKVIIFRERSIYYVSGDGPNETGDNNGYSEPESISTDVGCTEQRSVLLTPNGLMFKSAKGIYLLGRGLDVQYIGARIENFNTEGIVSSVLSDSLNEARFYTDQGNCLTYNYAFDKWSVSTNQSSVDADNWQSRTVSILNNRIFQEIENLYSDNAITYRARVKTSWIKLAGIQDFSRIWRVFVLGNFKSTHTLNVVVRYDYNDAYTETFTVNPLITDTQYQYSCHLRKQKCEAVQFEIFDSGIGGIGESMELTALTLECGMRKGAMKLPAVRKY
jgi:hypothetical protein